MWKLDAEKLAKKEYPKESCGIILLIEGKKVFQPCINISTDSDNFIIDPRQLADIEDMGKVFGIFHSHCNCYEIPKPSSNDIYGYNIYKVPWYILGLPSNLWYKYNE